MNPPEDEHFIRELIRQGEGQHVEFKQILKINHESDKDDLARNIAAMAVYGGYILFGVTDDGKICGLELERPPKKTCEQIHQIIERRCLPPVSFECRPYEIDGKLILVIKVPRSEHGIHQLVKDRRFPIRRGTNVDYATYPEIQRFLSPIRWPSKHASLEGIGPSLAPFPKRGSKMTTRLFEDNSIFIFNQGKLKYRVCSKRGPVWHMADCPVFVPSLSWVPPPKLEGIGVPLCASQERRHLKLDDVLSNLEELKGIWYGLEPGTLMAARNPIFWSLSIDGALTYGCDIENLKASLHEIGRSDPWNRTVANVIMHGAFGEHYDHTCILVISAYWKYGIVRNLWIRMLLSSIPRDDEWIDKIFSIFGEPPQSYTTQPLYGARWLCRPRTKRVRPIGAIRREGVRMHENEEETGAYSGIIINSKDLKPYEYTRLHDLKFSFEDFPLVSSLITDLDDIVMSSTPFMFCNEVESPNIRIAYVSAEAWMLRMPAHKVFVITGLCSLVRPKS